MNVIKNMALGLLGFLLFLSLIIFGFAFLLNQTVLNADFYTAEMDKLDVSLLVEESLSELIGENELPLDLETSIVDTTATLEPLIKEQTSAVIHSVSDYLKGKKPAPELAKTLGNTFLNSDFVVSVMDELDIASLAEETISEQFTGEAFPEEFQAALVNTINKLEPAIIEKTGAAADPILNYLLGESPDINLAGTLRSTIITSDFVITLVDELDTASLAASFLREQISGKISPEMEYLLEYMETALAELEPVIKEAVIAAADPILDYLMGQRQNLSIVISLEPVMESMKASLKETFRELPPVKYTGLLPSQLDQLFDEFFDNEFTKIIPLSLELNETLFGTEIPRQISEALAQAETSLGDGRRSIAEGIATAEEGLEEARLYVGYFQLGYLVLIALILLLTAGIILLHRRVKDASRSLGVIFLVYGALQYAGILAVKSFADREIRLPDIPSSLQTWLSQLINDSLSPLEMFSLGLLIGGIALIIVSFVYKPRQSATTN